MKGKRELLGYLNSVSMETGLLPRVLDNPNLFGLNERELCVRW